MKTENKTLLSKEKETQLKEKEEFKIPIELLTSPTVDPRVEPTLKPLYTLMEETKKEIESLRKDLRTLDLNKFFQESITITSPPKDITLTPSDNTNTTEVRITDTEKVGPLSGSPLKEYPLDKKLCYQVKQKDRKFLSFLRRTKKTIKKYAKKLTVLILLPIRTVYKSFSKISIGR